MQDYTCLRRFPDARVGGVGAQLPVLPVEGHPLDGIKIDAVKAAGVDHVIGGIRSRTIERGDTAVAAEVVQRTLGAGPVSDLSAGQAPNEKKTGARN